jgi:hypothetical protein
VDRRYAFKFKIKFGESTMPPTWLDDKLIDHIAFGLQTHDTNESSANSIEHPLHPTVVNCFLVPYRILGEDCNNPDWTLVNERLTCYSIKTKQTGTNGTSAFNLQKLNIYFDCGKSLQHALRVLGGGDKTTMENSEQESIDKQSDHSVSFIQVHGNRIS